MVFEAELPAELVEEDLTVKATKKKAVKKAVKKAITKNAKNAKTSSKALKAADEPKVNPIDGTIMLKVHVHGLLKSVVW